MLSRCSCHWQRPTDWWTTASRLDSLLKHGTSVSCTINQLADLGYHSWWYNICIHIPSWIPYIHIYHHEISWITSNYTCTICFCSSKLGWYHQMNHWQWDGCSAPHGGPVMTRERTQRTVAGRASPMVCKVSYKGMASLSWPVDAKGEGFSTHVLRPRQAVLAKTSCWPSKFRPVGFQEMLTLFLGL